MSSRASQSNTTVLADSHEGIGRVIEAFDEIVRSDGGHVSFVAIDGGRLRVAYAAGVNEDCPSCVMEPDALGLMLHDMLREHAPEVEEVVVEAALPGASRTP